MELRGERVVHHLAQNVEQITGLERGQAVVLQSVYVDAAILDWTLSGNWQNPRIRMQSI